ncbi:MAG: hypothetical protein K9N51_13840 [Candidatus Pacebacteria bacterium]|nr:hypothetical protein [Candidatus Paceibacterota bacterium]
MMSYLKEAWDLAVANIGQAVISDGCWPMLPTFVQHYIGKSARSAFQPSDFTDNEIGRGIGLALDAAGMSVTEALMRKCCEKGCDNGGVPHDALDGFGSGGREFGSYTLKPAIYDVLVADVAVYESTCCDF